MEQFDQFKYIGTYNVPLFSLLHVLKGKDSIVHTGSKCHYREGRKQVVKHLFLSKGRIEGREYVSLKVKKMTTQKLENIFLALDLDLQTYGWEAALLQLTKSIKLLQVITIMFVYKYLFKREEIY